LVAFHLAGDDLPYDESDISGLLAAERGWMVPAYTLPPNAEDVMVMRALVKENVSHSGARTLVDDMTKACDTLDKRGGGVPEGAKRRAQRLVGA
jgi:glutamate decarboxylase